MDPNKIHIDELVRQRLQGGEEEPRPGAWIAMRELLDKQMPIGGARPLGGMAWGKAARWTTGLVLATLLAGGYGMMNNHIASRKSAENNSIASRDVMTSTPRFASGTTASSTSTRTNSGRPASNDQSTAPTAALSNDVATTSRPVSGRLANNQSSTSYLSSAELHTAPRHDTRTTLSNSVLSTASDKASSEIRTKPARNGEKTVASSRSTTPRASINASSVVPSKKSGEVSSSPNSSPKEENNTVAATSSKPSRASERRAENAKTRRSPRTRETAGIANATETASATRVESPRSLRTRNSRGGGIKPANIADSNRAQVKRDTVHPILVAHRYMSTRGVRGGHYVTDTLAAEPFVTERLLPTVATTTSSHATTSPNTSRARRTIFGRKKTSQPEGLASASATPAKALPNAAEMKKTSTAAVVPAASAPVASAAASSAAAGEALVPLSSKMVSSTKSVKMQYSAQEQIQDMVRRTQFLFGQMRLYTGVTGGFNGSVGGTSMGGFHAGLFGLLAINERWSAGLEGKFVQRFNRGTELHDPYFHYRASTFNRFERNGEAYNVYRVTTDSFDHYYKLSTIETIELPVYARYSFRRFHAFGGANLTYGLRVKNIERVERFAGRESSGMDTVLASTQYAPPANTAASVKIDDFGPRFGLGYTAGVGYQASPAVLVDVRMTQLVWDNRSAASGGLRVSQTFYRVPSLQLSIGYRFSQRMSRR